MTRFHIDVRPDGVGTGEYFAVFCFHREVTHAKKSFEAARPCMILPLHRGMDSGAHESATRTAPRRSLVFELRNALADRFRLEGTAVLKVIDQPGR